MVLTEYGGYERDMLLLHEAKRSYDDYLRSAALIVASATSDKAAKAAIDILAHTLPGTKDKLKDDMSDVAKQMLPWINKRYNLSMYGESGLLEISNDGEGVRSSDS